MAVMQRIQNRDFAREVEEQDVSTRPGQWVKRHPAACATAGTRVQTDAIPVAAAASVA